MYGKSVCPAAVFFFSAAGQIMLPIALILTCKYHKNVTGPSCFYKIGIFDLFHRISFFRNRAIPIPEVKTIIRNE